MWWLVTVLALVAALATPGAAQDGAVIDQLRTYWPALESAYGWPASTTLFDPNTNCGAFSRIDCTVPGRVTGLDFSSVPLSTTIPMSLLTQLSELQSLRLYNLSLTGTIDPIALPPKIQRVDLSNNRQLTGVLPSEWQTGPIPLSELRWFYVSNTLLGGPIPSFDASPNLLELSVSDTSMTGPFPNNIGGAMMERIYMRNVAPGTIPAASWGNFMPNLYLLDISNSMAGPMPEFQGTMPNLHHLYMSGNRQRVPEGTRLPYSYPFEIPKLCKFKTVDNNLVGTIGAEWHWLNFPISEDFTLQWNRFQGPIPELFRDDMTNLDVSNNQLSGTIPPTVGMMSLRLWALSLHNNRFQGTLPPSMSSLASSIRGLRLSNNLFTGALPDLSQLTLLQDFYVADNQLSGSIVQNVGAGKALLTSARCTIDKNCFDYVDPVVWQHCHPALIEGPSTSTCVPPQAVPPSPPEPPVLSTPPTSPEPALTPVVGGVAQQADAVHVVPGNWTEERPDGSTTGPSPVVRPTGWLREERLVRMWDQQVFSSTRYAANLTNGAWVEYQYTLFDRPAVVSQAGFRFPVAPGTVKMTVSLRAWPLASSNNDVVWRMRLVPDTSALLCVSGCCASRVSEQATIPTAVPLHTATVERDGGRHRVHVRFLGSALVNQQPVPVRSTIQLAADGALEAEVRFAAARFVVWDPDVSAVVDPSMDDACDGDDGPSVALVAGVGIAAVVVVGAVGAFLWHRAARSRKAERRRIAQLHPGSVAKTRTQTQAQSSVQVGAGTGAGAAASVRSPSLRSSTASVAAAEMFAANAADSRRGTSNWAAPRPSTLVPMTRTVDTMIIDDSDDSDDEKEGVVDVDDDNAKDATHDEEDVPEEIAQDTVVEESVEPEAVEPEAVEPEAVEPEAVKPVEQEPTLTGGSRVGMEPAVPYVRPVDFSRPAPQPSFALAAVPAYAGPVTDRAAHEIALSPRSQQRRDAQEATGGGEIDDSGVDGANDDADAAADAMLS